MGILVPFLKGSYSSKGEMVMVFPLGTLVFWLFPAGGEGRVA